MQCRYYFSYYYLNNQNSRPRTHTYTSYKNTHTRPPTHGVIYSAPNSIDKINFLHKSFPLKLIAQTPTLRHWTHPLPLPLPSTLLLPLPLPTPTLIIPPPLPSVPHMYPMATLQTPTHPPIIIPLWVSTPYPCPPATSTTTSSKHTLPFTPSSRRSRHDSFIIYRA